MVDFIETTIRTAVQVGDVKMQEDAELFKENLVFVGEKELKKATQGIAQHLLEEAQSIVEAVGRYRETLGNCRIIVPDDFVVSGTRIQGFADRIYNGLLNQGLTPDKSIGSH